MVIAPHFRGAINREILLHGIVARRIVDKHMLHLVKMWLKVPVEERDESGSTRLTGGKDRHCGTPQGGVISPLLANILAQE